jgi:hypothetical protein
VCKEGRRAIKQRRRNKWRKKEGRRKRKKEELLVFVKTCLFGKIIKNKKSKFYWKVPTINIF